MAAWRRVGRVKAYVGQFAVVSVLGLGLAAAGLTSLLLGQRLLGVNTILYTSFAAVVGVISARQILVGTYLGRRGVRVRSLLRTRTVRWADIDRFEFRQGKDIFRGTGNLRSIWIVTRSSAVKTPLCYRRREIDPTKDTVEQPVFFREGISLVLSERDCRLALRRLQAAQDRFRPVR